MQISENRRFTKSDGETQIGAALMPKTTYIWPLWPGGSWVQEGVEGLFFSLLKSKSKSVVKFYPLLFGLSVVQVYVLPCYGGNWSLTKYRDRK